MRKLISLSTGVSLSLPHLFELSNWQLNPMPEAERHARPQANHLTPLAVRETHHQSRLRLSNSFSFFFHLEGKWAAPRGHEPITDTPLSCAEPEAGGRDLDGRVRRVHLPAAPGVPAPVPGGPLGAEGAAQTAQVQGLQVVHGSRGLGRAQVLPSGGAPARGLGGGEAPGSPAPRGKQRLCPPSPAGVGWGLSGQ